MIWEPPSVTDSSVMQFLVEKSVKSVALLCINYCSPESGEQDPKVCKNSK